MKSLDAIERMTGLKMMKIAFNGALIEHNGKHIRDVRLSREAFIKAIEFLKGKASALIAFTPDSYAIMADDFWLEEQDRILGEPGIAIYTGSEGYGGAIYERVVRMLGDAGRPVLVSDSRDEILAFISRVS